MTRRKASIRRNDRRFEIESRYDFRAISIGLERGRMDRAREQPGALPRKSRKQFLSLTILSSCASLFPLLHQSLPVPSLTVTLRHSFPVLSLHLPPSTYLSYIGLYRSLYHRISTSVFWTPLTEHNKAIHLALAAAYLSRTAGLFSED